MGDTKGNLLSVRARSVRGFVSQYVQKTQQFSRNANLYVLHVIGMDMIHGSFNVLFNLYLLAIGFDVHFVGLRLMIGFLAEAITAVPAGLLSDRIGRKASFVIGDGVGATIALTMIHTQSEPVLLAGAALGGFFTNLHATSEAAFMMENSRPSERVHLFSVASSFRTFSAMLGALLAGLVPALFIDDIGKVAAYRDATYAGLALWFLSLIPALMLRSGEAIERPEITLGSSGTRRGWKTLFSDIHHPRHVAFFVITSALVYFGSGAVVPMMNVVFHEGHTNAGEGQIGVLFAIGELGVALAALCVPILAARMLKVDAIALTRLLALPFVVGMGLLPLLTLEGGVLLGLFGACYVGRATLFRVSFPLDDAFNMEVLNPRERATTTGIELAIGSGLSALAVAIGSRLMASGDYTTPFLLMAAAYFASTLIYWRAFRALEGSNLMAPPPDLGWKPPAQPDA